ncbi:MAG: orotidine 5'-phosphate decarboxylase / HUMPS family protein [Candidatus Bathyarchaeia archaeon]
MACDVTDLKALGRLVKALSDVGFIAGFKLGMYLTLKYGLNTTVETVKKWSDKPLIYDHQKFGTDIPDICGGDALKLIKDAGIEGLIVFPQSGVETLKSAVKGCQTYGLTPIIGGAMTHKGFLTSEGGYIEDEAPERIYRDAAKLGVDHFVLPGNRISFMREFTGKIISWISEPKILFPGVGSGQGGSIKEAFQATLRASSYAILGRSIYQSPNPRKTAQELWKEVEGLFTGRGGSY